MEMRRIKVEIDPKGNYTFHALEGFAGTSCVAATQELELAIGGAVAAEGKKPSYYDPDDSNPVSITL